MKKGPRLSSRKHPINLESQLFKRKWALNLFFRSCNYCIAEQEWNGTTEDEVVGWHHWLNGHEFEQAPGVGDGQGSLECCSPWGRKESDTTERLNWTELNWKAEKLENTETCQPNHYNPTIWRKLPSVSVLRISFWKDVEINVDLHIDKDMHLHIFWLHETGISQYTGIP